MKKRILAVVLAATMLVGTAMSAVAAAPSFSKYVASVKYSYGTVTKTETLTKANLAKLDPTNNMGAGFAFAAVAQQYQIAQNDADAAYALYMELTTGLPFDSGKKVILPSGQEMLPTTIQDVWAAAVEMPYLTEEDFGLLVNPVTLDPTTATTGAINKTWYYCRRSTGIL